MFSLFPFSSSSSSSSQMSTRLRKIAFTRTCRDNVLTSNIPSPHPTHPRLNTESHNLLLASLNVTETSVKAPRSFSLHLAHNLQCNELNPQSSSKQRARSSFCYRSFERDEKYSSNIHSLYFILLSLSLSLSLSPTLPFIFHLVRQTISKIETLAASLISEVA